MIRGFRFVSQLRLKERTMATVVQAGNAKSQAHVATVPLVPNLLLGTMVPPGNYRFFVTISSALAGPSGGHIVGFTVGGPGNRFLVSFDVWTDEAIAAFSWMVVE
jgi:hypothetical protein